MRIEKYLIGLLVLCSCVKPARHPAPSAEVSFTLSDHVTKLTGAPDGHESAVSHWAVFVFDTGSGWCRYGCSEDGTALSLSLTQGRRYECLAVVNYPRSGSRALNPPEIHGASQLRSCIAQLEENAPGYFLMTGERLLVPVARYAQLEILVERLVSRLDVEGIRVDFSSWPDWASESLLLRHIYVTNAYKTAPYGDIGLQQSALRTAWYNTLGWHGGGDASAALDMLLSERDIDVLIDGNHPYTTRHSFYFYPNPLAEDDRQTLEWTPRHTRLVIEAEVAGTVYYYPADIPSSLRRNQRCSAGEVVIRGPGSSSPEGTTLARNAFSVEWDGGEKITLD